MSKPVVLTTGAKPVTNVAGALPMTVVEALGQPVTLVEAGGMPVTLEGYSEEEAPVVTNPGTITATNLGNPDGEVYSISGFAYDGEGDLSYQWLRNDVEIEGETGATYTSTKATDSAKTIKRTTTVTNGAGSDSDTTPGQLLSWAPVTWVENSNTAAASRDGAFGSNSAAFTFAIMLRDPSIASVKNYYTVRDARLSVFTGGSPNTGTWRVTLKDTANTTLVDWSSTAGISDSGDWLYKVTANLVGETPTMVVTRWEITDGVAGEKETVAGSFGTGPAAGTIDCARTGSGADRFLLSSTGVTNLANCETGYIGIWHEALADADFVTDEGLVIDPSSIGSPVGLFYGPAATFTTNHGSGGDFAVSAGSFTDS